MSPTLPPAVQAYLGGHSVMTLATQSPDGPWAAAVFFAAHDDGLIFLSSPLSRHGRNLAQDPRCAATIQDDHNDWRSIQGIQLEGRVRELHGDERERALRCYGEKFPLVGQMARAPAAIVQALARVRWYCLQPQRVLFVDNTRGFGHRDEFGPPPG